MQRNIVSGILSVVSAKVVTLGIGIVTSPLLYQMLGPAKYGEYATVLSTHALFMIFVSAGITRGVRKYVAEDRYEPDWQSNVVGFYFRLAVALAAAGGLCYLLAVRSGVVTWLFDPTFEAYFTLMVAMVVVAQLWSFARRALMGFGLERYSEPLTIVYWAAFAAIALGLVSLGYGVIGALAGQILGTLIVAVVGMVLVVRRVSARALVRPAPSSFPRRKLLVYNTGTVALSFLLLSLYHVDVVMLQHLRGGAAVGNYKAALKLAEFLWFVPVTIQSVYVHSTSELWSQGHTERVADIASRTTRYTFLLTSIMVLGLASLADVVVPLYWGPEATPAITPLLLLLPGALGFAAVRPTLAIEEANGTLRYSLIATGVAAAVNLGLNAALIPRAGMAGAAVATSVGYGSMFALHVWSARKLGVDPLADARLGRIAVAAAVAAVPIFALPTVLSGPIQSLVVVPPVGLASFLALAFATGALEPDECLDLLSSFPGPVPHLVARIRNRERTGPVRTRGAVNGQRLLAALGLLLFVTGVGFTVVTATVGDTPDGPSNATATPVPSEVTPVPTVTAPGTDGPSTGNGSTTATAAGNTTTATPTDADGSSGPSVPNDDGGSDDSSEDGGGSDGDSDDGDGGSDDSGETTEETDGPTATPTETATDADDPSETPTVTETGTPTETTDSETPSDTRTATATATETTTETPTGTETTTTTATETTTDTATETETTTATETTTDTATDTETATATDTETETETEAATETAAETTSGEQTETGDDAQTTEDDGLLSLRLRPVPGVWF